MSPRLTVGQLMRVVAFLAVVLAAGRVHVSLGSLAFGILSIAWARTALWAEQRRAEGAEVGRLAAASDFISSLGFAAVRLAIALVPAAPFAVLGLGLAAGGHHRPPTGVGLGIATVAAVVGGFVGMRALRLIKNA